jgi:hypothetical protein
MLFHNVEIVRRIQDVELHDVHAVGIQALEAGIYGALNILRRSQGAVVVLVNALGGEDVRIPGNTVQSASQNRLAVSVALGGVDQIDAQIEAVSDEIILISGWHPGVLSELAGAS